jgi:hypothetical protein
MFILIRFFCYSKLYLDNNYEVCFFIIGNILFNMKRILCDLLRFENFVVFVLPTK